MFCTNFGFWLLGLHPIGAVNCGLSLQCPHRPLTCSSPLPSSTRLTLRRPEHLVGLVVEPAPTSGGFVSSLSCLLPVTPPLLPPLFKPVIHICSLSLSVFSVFLHLSALWRLAAHRGWMMMSCQSAATGCVHKEQYLISPLLLPPFGEDGV